mgnify:CR=1 FL=1
MRPTRFLGLAAAALLLASGLNPAPARAADCGSVDRVTVAEMTWLSGAIQAKLFARILEDGYGCDVEIVPGDTVPTATSMLTKGKPMIAPEFWVNSMGDIWDKLMEQEAVYKAGEIYAEGGNEGWWIPDYVAEEHPGLETIADLPEYKELFAEAAAGGKARLYNCPPGWACENTNRHLFQALDLGNKGYELFSPGSGANLKAVIARKVTRREPVVTYYWGPTAVLGRYNLVKLEIPAPYDEDRFNCLASKDCQDPQLSAWKSSTVAVGVVPRLKEEAPDVVAFCEKVQMPNAVINKVLGWTDERSAEAEAGAEYFLKNYEDLWTQWVPADVAERIRASL